MIYRTVSLLVVLLLVPAVGWSDDARPIGQLMVQLTTDDGVQIPGVLMYPANGINNSAPAIVLQHGGPSGHAARQIGAYRFAAERLAALGYTTISPVSRQSDDYYKSKFDEIIYDLGAAVDFVSALGHERIVLLGHSIGSLRITRYTVRTQDPRIKAHVHFAPTADMYPLYKDREGAAAMFAAAQAAVAAGNGGWNVSPEEPDADPSLRAPVMLATAPGRLQTAEVLLDWWGPTANTSNSDWFKHIRVPLLLLGGVDDPVVPPGRLEALAALATNSPRVDYRWYEGGDHYFTGFEDASSSYVAEWLEDIRAWARSARCHQAGWTYHWTCDLPATVPGYAIRAWPTSPLL